MTRKDLWESDTQLIWASMQSHTMVKIVPGRRNSNSRGPERQKNLVYLRNEKKANVVGHKYSKNGRKMIGVGVRAGGRSRIT